MKMIKADICKQSIVILTLVVFVLGLGGAQAWAAALDPGTVRAAALAAGLDSLSKTPVPEVINLNEFLKPGPEAQKAAIRLGKALFWDMQVGSDGQACASCHFHAGADNRARNQLSPGLKAGDDLFGNNTIGVPGFPQFTPDYTLVDTDFPLHVLADPEENNFLNRVVLADTNDVVSSMGVFAATFLDINPGVSEDIGSPFVDPIFNLLNPAAFQIDDNVRRVEPRNTPTMINAVFNHSNFWDGRAHNQFNGVSPIGPLDEGAMIWVNEAGQLAQKQVLIPNSSLASQAVGPALSNLEMSFFDRSFPLVGRKLFSLRPLSLQMVDPNDSVLGEISGARHGLNGIDLSYRRMIRQAFQPQYWASDQLTPDGFRLMEANFSLFFGLAVQMYETTLVSDKTPLDRFMQGRNRALDEEQLIGLLVFLNRGKLPDGTSRNVPEVDAVIAEAEAALGITIGAGNCVSCHGGPELTDASVASVSEEPIEVEETTILVDGFLQVSAETSFIDNGFANIGVRQTEDDLGRGEGEAQGFPFPLSLARQALLGLEFAPELPVDECGIDPVCPVDNRVSVDGAFKIPGLRNVELTGPYFHNGGQATLDQVVEFYDRQGDCSDHNVDNLERNM
ncbi:MAG: hypothetical protein HZC49_01070, partial [Nitrospirae bacterium]|nr:hypothetical protein [Nitrospirota bacterium]